jgi:hypothetical protein
VIAVAPELRCHSPLAELAVAGGLGVLDCGLPVHRANERVSAVGSNEPPLHATLVQLSRSACASSGRAVGSISCVVMAVLPPVDTS